MNKGKIWLGLLVIFVAGCAVGAAGTGLYVRHKILSTINEGPPAISRLIVERLANRLELDAQQQQDITIIVTKKQQELRHLRKRIQPDVVRLIGEAIKDIRQHLSPAQQQELDVLATTLQQRWWLEPQQR